MGKVLKSDTWDINAKVNMLYKGVQFEEPLTKEEAIDAFLDGAYVDIADEELVEIDYVYEDDGTEAVEGTSMDEDDEDEE